MMYQLQQMTGGQQNQECYRNEHIQSEKIGDKCEFGSSLTQRKNWTLRQ